MIEQRTHTAPEASSILLKAFDILDAFNYQERPVLTLSQLARRSGLPKSTVHRVLGMLLAVGAVERHDSGYRVGWRLFSLSTASQECLLLRVAMPYLLDLHRETSLPMFVARRYGRNVGYLQQLVRKERVPAMAGNLVPARDTAEGRTLLAFGTEAEIAAALTGPPRLPPEEADRLRNRLRPIRASRIAMEEKSLVRGYGCTVAPVMVDGGAVLAVSIAHPPAPEDSRQFVEPLRSIAANIARAVDQRIPHIVWQPPA